MWRLLSMGYILVVGLVIAGCENPEKGAIPTTDSGQKLYHEIGDTFEFEGPESGLPFEVTVEDIWMEDFEDHEDYISAHVKKPNEDDDAVIFVSYTIKNKGDETYAFKDDRFYPNNDVLPNLIHPANYILDVDIAYPEDGPVDDMEDVTDLTLDPGESMEITGSVLTNPRNKDEGAFVWDYDADIPQVLFTRPQSERRDQVGVYDIGEPIYVEDYKDTRFNVTIDDVDDIESDEDVEVIDREYDDSAFLVVDMTIENDGNEDIVVPDALPEINDVHSVDTRRYFIKKGETEPIDDVYINPGEQPTDGRVEAGETLEGTLYYEVRNTSYGEVLKLDAQIYFPYVGFEDYPYYQQWVNYHLD